jgi:hypothetical protein
LSFRANWISLSFSIIWASIDLITAFWRSYESSEEGFILFWKGNECIYYYKIR